jgi:hypothetical protein
MKRIIAGLIAATFAVGAPVGALAQDRDRDRERERERYEREDRPRRPLSDSVPSNCRFSRELPDGRKVFRCEVAPGRYVDRVF